MMTKKVAKNATEFSKLFQKLTSGKHQAQQVWRDFVFVSAIAISNSVDIENFDARERRYFEIIKQYRPDELPIFERMLLVTVNALQADSEQDFLGTIFMQVEFGSNRKGQFFTPYSVCQATADFNGKHLLNLIKSNGYVSIMDPTCGAGAMLIASMNAILRQSNYDLNWQNHILFAAQDLDEVAGLMCYIQLSLLGCAGYVKIADALESPMSANDGHEDYWFTPMYYSKVWHDRRLFQNMRQFFSAASFVKRPHEKEGFDFTFAERANGQLSIF